MGGKLGLNQLGQFKLGDSQVEEESVCTFTYDVDEAYTYAPTEEYTYDPCASD